MVYSGVESNLIIANGQYAAVVWRPDKTFCD